jgi:transcriptional regulator with XRE-family HTH domain
MSNAIAKRIRELREKKSWTQATLAEASKLSERTVRRIEAGGVHPSAETVLSLAGALEIEALELTALANQELKPQAKSRLTIPRDGLELLNAVSGSHAFKFCPEPTDDEEASHLIRLILDFVGYGKFGTNCRRPRSMMRARS